MYLNSTSTHIDTYKNKSHTQNILLLRTPLLDIGLISVYNTRVQPNSGEALSDPSQLEREVSLEARGDIRVLSYAAFIEQLPTLTPEPGLVVEVTDLPLECIPHTDVLPTSAVKVRKYADLLRHVLQEPAKYPTAINGVYQPIFVVWTGNGPRLADGSHRYKATSLVADAPETHLPRTIYSRIIFGDERTLLHHRLFAQPVADLRNFAHTRLLRFIIDTYEGSGYSANLPFGIAVQNMNQYIAYVRAGGGEGPEVSELFRSNMISDLRRAIAASLLPHNSTCSDVELLDAFDTAYQMVKTFGLRVDEVDRFLRMRRMLDPTIVEMIRADNADLPSGEVPYVVAQELSAGVLASRFPVQRAVVSLLRGFTSPLDRTRPIEPTVDSIKKLVRAISLGQQHNNLISTIQEVSERSSTGRDVSPIDAEVQFQEYLEAILKIVLVRGSHPQLVSRFVDLMRNDLQSPDGVPTYQARSSVDEYAFTLSLRQKEIMRSTTPKVTPGAAVVDTTKREDEPAQPNPSTLGIQGPVIPDPSSERAAASPEPLSIPPRPSTDSGSELQAPDTPLSRSTDVPAIFRETRPTRQPSEQLLTAVAALREEMVKLVHARMLLVTEVASAWVRTAVLEYCIEEGLPAESARSIVATMEPIVTKAPFIYVEYFGTFSGNGTRDAVSRQVKQVCHQVLSNISDPAAVKGVIGDVLQGETEGREQLMRLLNRTVGRRPKDVTLHDIVQGLMAIQDLTTRVTRPLLSAIAPLTDPEDPRMWRLVEEAEHDGDDEETDGEGSEDAVDDDY
jgi:hypothetical protein